MLDATRSAGAAGQARRHDSGHKHVSGQAIYIDDIPEPPGLLHGCFGLSEVAHARIKHLDLSAVREAGGVVAVLAAADIPGINDVSPVAGDDPLFAVDEIEHVGQPLFLVLATTRFAARAAARRAVLDADPLPALVDIAAADAAGSLVQPTYDAARGDAGAAIAGAPHRVSGRFTVGGQDHFYLEGQIALCIPGEDDDLHVYSSTQHPSEVQHKLASLLEVRVHALTVETRRMGGAFGGKESQASLFAAAAALGAKLTGRPVKVRPDRDDDMLATGKRHDFVIDYTAGFDEMGVIAGVDFRLASRCGRSQDLSGPVNDRAVFHVDNAYYLENVSVHSLRLKTHTVSNTAFRGFGGPQGMLAIERVIEHIASELQLDPLTVRQRNVYGPAPRNTTHYEMEVVQNHLPRIMQGLADKADYAGRRAAIREFNAGSPVLKRGLSLTPVKFGISFTNTALNQAGALLHVYTDGSVQINHGGTEMGQGLFVKVAQVVARELNIDLEHIKPTSTRTDKVPNTSATAASSGSDLNGAAARAAARKIKSRLTEFAAGRYDVAPEAVRFLPNRVAVGDREFTFTDLVRQAYFARVPLSATGYYRTPKIHYDRDTARGRPFFYFAQGAAISEVLLDGLTGEYRFTRVDILHDCGESLNPAMDRGQIEGGFIQGLGWLTSEELVYDDSGRLLTHAPSTYKIPTARDRPEAFHIELLADAPNAEETVFRSKAVGEPPLMLAMSGFFALADAVAACVDYRMFPDLDTPATPEQVLLTIERLRREVAK